MWFFKQEWNVAKYKCEYEKKMEQLRKEAKLISDV